MLIEVETTIAAPPSLVFAFHESPGAFTRLIPPWERIERIFGGDVMPLGKRAVYRVWVGKMPVPLEVERAEYEPGRRFADRQVRGPFAHWYHRQIFFDDEHGGTLLRDEVDYELPFGSLGRRWAGKYVWRKLWKLFEFRHEATRRIIESGDYPGAAAATQPRVESAEFDPRTDPAAHRAVTSSKLLRGDYVEGVPAP